MGKTEYLAIGKVVGTHGIRGLLKVVSYAESLEPFAPGRAFTFARQGMPVGHHVVVSSRLHKRAVLLAMEGITSIEEAEPWVGCDLVVERRSLPKLEDGDYYWFEIIGLDVQTLDQRYLGRVEAIFPTGSNDVYVVRNGRKEVLIPAIESVVVEIDLQKRLLTVDLPEGLED